MKAYMRGVLGKAKQGNFAIPATNFIDWNSAKAYVEMSEELNLPLILAFAQVHSPYLSLEEAASIGKYFQEKAKTPVVLHLDHGQYLEFIKKAIQLGFNSVMIDASLDSFEENVRKTKEVVEEPKENISDTRSRKMIKLAIGLLLVTSVALLIYAAFEAYALLM